MYGILFVCSLFFAIKPVIANIGGTASFNVFSRSSGTLAVMIFRISGFFEMKLWNPSMKIISNFSFSNNFKTLSKSLGAVFVFSIIAISSGEIATVIFDPALVNLHVFVPSLSMVKPSR